MLAVKNLKASVNGDEILKGVSLEIKPGELCVLMGPNGSGKSTLAQTLMGSMKYEVRSMKIELDGRDISKLTPDKRAKLGLFLAFQNPVEVPGVSYFNFLRLAVKNGESLIDFKKKIVKTAQSLGFEENLLSRSLNDGFSGGEKRKSEILQALTLAPKYAILDEPDSGLDIDAQKIMAEKISELVKSGTGILLITHNPRILKFLKPDKVYIMVDGKIVRDGLNGIVSDLEVSGFDIFKSEVKHA